MFTPTSFGAEFTFDRIISHVRVCWACETDVHWVHSIRRKSVIDALFKTTLKLLNRLFERPFVYEYGKFQSCVRSVVLRHLVPRTDPLQLSVVILSV